MHSDYTKPEVNDKDKFQRVNPRTFDTNRFLKANNNLGDEAIDPKQTIFQVSLKI